MALILTSWPQNESMKSNWVNWIEFSVPDRHLLYHCLVKVFVDAVLELSLATSLSMWTLPQAALTHCQSGYG